MIKFLLFSILLASEGQAAMNCEAPVVSPRPIGCTSNLSYCEYRRVYCTGIPMTLVQQILYGVTTTPYFDRAPTALQGQLDGVCAPVGTTCPSATECLDPTNEKSKLPANVRAALEKDRELANAINKATGNTPKGVR